MLTGRKLLLADDSAAIQKVIDLTFSDEGMKVTTVSDGRAALNELEQFPAPDIVLADASMPEIGGLELCQIIKHNERFNAIPVILLISSFEPFNEAQAKAAGADDIVTKPFQSIRDLVSRVGALLGRSDVTSVTQHSTLGLTQPDAIPVEPSLEARSEPAIETSAAERAEIELQTADTRKLEQKPDEPVTDEPASSIEPSPGDDMSLQDTIEMRPVLPEATIETVKAAEPEPAEELYSQFAETTEIATQAPAIETAKASDDLLLDLDADFGQETVSDEVYLDLEFDQPAPMAAVEATRETSVAVTEERPAESLVAAPVGNLSSEAIDAIARRVVEQMSDRVVREIAWEVVPELSELLIKKKLDQQK